MVRLSDVLRQTLPELSSTQEQRALQILESLGVTHTSQLAGRVTQADLDGVLVPMQFNQLMKAFENDSIGNASCNVHHEIDETFFKRKGQRLAVRSLQKDYTPSNYVPNDDATQQNQETFADMNGDEKMGKKAFSIDMHHYALLQGYELPKVLPASLKADPEPTMGTFTQPEPVGFETFIMQGSPMMPQAMVIPAMQGVPMTQAALATGTLTTGMPAKDAFTYLQGSAGMPVMPPPVSPAANSTAPVEGISQADAWQVTTETRAKHDAQFYTLEPVNGFVTGTKARGFFIQSGLAISVLGQIWTLADMNGDDKMDKKEFSIAMHLIKKKLQGYELPKVLPASLKADPKPKMETLTQPAIMGFPMKVQPVPDIVTTGPGYHPDVRARSDVPNNASAGVTGVNTNRNIEDQLRILRLELTIEANNALHRQELEHEMQLARADGDRRVLQTQLELKEHERQKDLQFAEREKQTAVQLEMAKGDKQLLKQENASARMEIEHAKRETQLIKAVGNQMYQMYNKDRIRHKKQMGALEFRYKNLEAYNSLDGLQKMFTGKYDPSKKYTSQYAIVDVVDGDDNNDDDSLNVMPFLK